jgi:hypothetical protein
MHPHCSVVARALHVTRCLARGTDISRIETSNTREPIHPYAIRRCIEAYHVDGTPEERRKKAEENRVVVVEIVPSLANALGMGT